VRLLEASLTRQPVPGKRPALDASNELDTHQFVHVLEVHGHQFASIRHIIRLDEY
jgi:hypothetical protein